MRGVLCENLFQILQEFTELSDIEQSSRLQQYTGIFVSFFSGAAALFFFGYNTLYLIKALVEESRVISFDKGSVYLLGVGLGLGVVTYWFIRDVMKKPASAAYNQKATRIAIGVIIIMVVLPHIVHYAVGHYLKPRGYVVCDEASYQWLYDRTIVYTANSNVCVELVAEERHYK